MEAERFDEVPQAEGVPRFQLRWQTSLLMGVASLILGLIVAFHPSGSLNVITVLLGVLLILSGIFQLVAAIDGAEGSHVWPAIAGIVFILGGIVLIRHLNLSLALIGLFVGFSWVIQGIAAILAGFSGVGGGGGRIGWWPVIFGVISLIAGIVVVSTPVSAVTTLATFLGIWFAVMGVFQIVDALINRRGVHRAGAGRFHVPGQRASNAAAGDVAGGSPAAGRQTRG
jgi:uncharacterized membrane protein HdeD (DUF308 family)